MKKGTRKKYKILNQLFRRYTNRRKGYTPRKINLKPVADELFKYSQSVFDNISRIYELPLLNNTGSTISKVLDQYSYRNPEDLISIASSLNAHNVALGTVGLGAKLTYKYIFRNNHSYHEDNSREETSTLFYPGVYFCNIKIGSYYNKVWAHVSSLSTTLYVYDQDVTNSTTHEVDGTQIEGTFIFIPFDSIETPILQAYLPIRASIWFDKTYYIFYNINNTQVPIPINVRYGSYWMGINLNKEVINSGLNNHYSYGVYGLALNFRESSYIDPIGRAYLNSIYSSSSYIYVLVRKDNVTLEQTLFRDQYYLFTATFLRSTLVDTGSTLEKNFPCTNLSDDLTCYLFVAIARTEPLIGQVYTGVCLGEYSTHLGVPYSSYKKFSRVDRERLNELSSSVGEQFSFPFSVSF